MLNYTYPGVYIQELPSGVHAITGVATSIAAFIGWAPQGPTDKAVLVQGVMEFDRQYGGLNAKSYLGYAVRHFFANGGQQAYIVRVVWDGTLPPAPGTTPTACATASVTGIGNSTSVITATLASVSARTTLAVSSPTLISIAVASANPTIPVGAKQQFIATGTFSDDSVQVVTATWNSSDPTIATVDPSTGLATGVAAGTANITATVGTVTSGSAITVRALTSIAVTPVPTIPRQAKQQFVATGTYSDGTTQDVTEFATWSSSDQAKANVDPSTGLATTVAVGATDITAKIGAVTSSPTTLTVSAATLTSIAVTPASPRVPVGATQQFTATGTYSDNSTRDLTDSATWTSGTPATVTINGGTGLATAITPGSSLIKASMPGVDGPANFIVSADAPTSIAITPQNPTVHVGNTQQFTATGLFSDGSKYDLPNAVTWSSGNAAVATINNSGLATGVGANSAALTLFARNPGQWGNKLRIVVTRQTADPTRFSLQVQDSDGNVQESFVNLSTQQQDPQGRYVVNVIDADSQYVTFIDPAKPTIAPSPPDGTPDTTVSPVALIGGADGTVLSAATDRNFEIALGSTPDATNPYGLHLLDRVDIFNLLCVPGETDAATIQDLQKYCRDKRAFYIVDAPRAATTANLTSSGPGNITGDNAINSAYYYPWVWAPDLLDGNRPRLYPPCGFVAGIYAKTDASVGVWKAPAGINASLSSVSGIQYVLTDLENGNLNIQAINCLREFKVYGDLVWGARTLRGNDQTGSEWKYVPIRRLALFLESSLYASTQWVVFEPNDERLWSQIRLNVGAFMQGLFLQGAFQGTTPQKAYFVTCDANNNPQSSIARGVVNILVGFAPLYPAEFVVIQIQQIAGQTQS